MRRKYHTYTKIFFPDPYVIRVSYPGDMAYGAADVQYNSLVRRTYKLIKGTWGYTSLQGEVIRYADNFNYISPFNGLNNNGLLISPSPKYNDQLRGYFCFKDEMDALQFRLSLEITAVHVRIWPSERKFIIHEVIESDES